MKTEWDSSPDALKAIGFILLIIFVVYFGIAEFVFRFRNPCLTKTELLLSPVAALTFRGDMCKNR